MTQQQPHPKHAGFAVGGVILVDPKKTEAWFLRWDREFRFKYWVERDGKFYPR